MKIIKTIGYTSKLSQSQDSESTESQIQNLPLPPNVMQAVLVAMKECQDPYCQTYIRALPQTAQQFPDDLEHALKVQVNYIYANCETYNNEEVKKILADYAGVPLQHRFGAEDSEDQEWREVEVGRFKNDMDAERSLMENIEHRRYKKIGDEFVVFEDQPSTGM